MTQLSPDQVQGQDESLLQLLHDEPIALARSGQNDIINLQTLGNTCNQQKKHPFDFCFRRQFDL